MGARPLGIQTTWRLSRLDDGCRCIQPVHGARASSRSAELHLQDATSESSQLAVTHPGAARRGAA